MTESTPAQAEIATIETAEIATIEPASALSKEQVVALMGTLSEGRVSQRKGGGGSSLSYLEAWDVKATLIRVFGFGNFSAEVIESDLVRVIPDEKEVKRFTVLAKATVRLTIHATGAIYTESAAASQSGTQGVGEVADFALKTAESDALKRCAIYLGTQFGLSLYDDGKRADVVRTVLDPAQRAYLAEAEAEFKARKAAADADVQGSMKTSAPSA